MEDRQIVDLYWARSEDAICETQLKYGRYCLAIASNILPFREDAEESVNDTYLAAWNSMPPHKPCILSTYLGKITRRISIDIFRKKNRQKRKASEYALSLAELVDCVEGGGTPEEDMEVKLLADAINETLDNEYSYEYDRHSKRVKRPKKEIGMHAIRGGTIVGEHEIIFAGRDEIIKLSHSARSKEIFAVGAVNAALYLKNQNKGIYSMSDLLADN